MVRRWVWSVLVVAAVGCAGPEVVEVGPLGGLPESGTSRSVPSTPAVPPSPGTGTGAGSSPGTGSGGTGSGGSGSGGSGSGGSGSGNAGSAGSGSGGSVAPGPAPGPAAPAPAPVPDPAPVPAPAPAGPDPAPVPGSPVGPGGGDEEEGGGAVGAPLAIPTFSNTGAPYDRNNKADVESRIKKACGGTLCVEFEFVVEPDPEQTGDCVVNRFEWTEPIYADRPDSIITIVVNNTDNCGEDPDAGEEVGDDGGDDPDDGEAP